MSKPPVRTTKVSEGNWKVEGIPNHARSLHVVIRGWPSDGAVEQMAVDDADTQASAVSWLFGFVLREKGPTGNALNKVNAYTIELNSDLLAAGEQFVLYYKIKYFDGTPGSPTGSYKGSKLTHVEHQTEVLDLNNSRVTQKSDSIYLVSLEWGDPAIGIR